MQIRTNRSKFVLTCLFVQPFKSPKVLSYNHMRLSVSRQAKVPYLAIRVWSLWALQPSTFQPKTKHGKFVIVITEAREILLWRYIVARIFPLYFARTSASPRSPLRPLCHVLNIMEKSQAKWKPPPRPNSRSIALFSVVCAWLRI